MGGVFHSPGINALSCTRRPPKKVKRAPTTLVSTPKTPECLLLIGSLSNKFALSYARVTFQPGGGVPPRSPPPPAPPLDHPPRNLPLFGMGSTEQRPASISAFCPPSFCCGLHSLPHRQRPHSELPPHQTREPGRWPSGLQQVVLQDECRDRLRHQPLVDHGGDEPTAV